MNRERIKEYLVHPVFISLILWIIIISFTPPIFKKYRIKLMGDNYTSTKTWNLFSDLDSDKKNEEVSIDLNDSKQTKVIVKKNNKVLNEYDLPGQVQGNFLPYVGDYDVDGFRELYFFTMTQDSIFLNIIDPVKTRKLIVRNRFIDFRYSLRNSSDAPIMMVAGMVNSDIGKTRDLVFLIQTGFSKKPRNIYKYLISADSLLKSPESSVVLAEATICDINNDSLPEFILSTAATGNYDEFSPYTDKYTWLMVLDHNLQFLFPPVKLSKQPSNLHVLPYKLNDRYFLLLFQNYFGNESIYSCFYLYDTNGNKILEREISNLESEISYALPGNDTARGTFYLIKNGKTDIDVYDRNMYPVRSLTMPPVAAGLPITCFDADDDGQNEYMFVGNGSRSLIITRADLKDPISFQYPDIHGVPIITKIPGEGQKSMMNTQFDGRILFLSYSKNPFYYFKYPFYGSVYLLTLLFISLLYYIQRYRINIKQETERRIASLQIKAIKNQLDPHFTLNILNSIASLYATDNDRERVDYIFGKYARLIRQTVISSDKILIRLEEELEFVRNYLDLEKFRASESFDYTIDVDKEVDLETKIPRMLIHTFIENAINHGLRMITKPGLLKITVISEASSYKIIIEDNGPGLNSSEKSSTSTGRGLMILDEMIELYYKLEKRRISYSLQNIDMEQNIRTGTRAVIKLTR